MKHNNKKYDRKQLEKVGDDNAGLSMFYQVALPSRLQEHVAVSDEIYNFKNPDKFNPYSDIQPEYMSLFIKRKTDHTKHGERSQPSTNESKIIRKLKTENKSVKSASTETNDIKENKSKITKFLRRFFK